MSGTPVRSKPGTSQAAAGKEYRVQQTRHQGLQSAHLPPPDSTGSNSDKETSPTTNTVNPAAVALVGTNVVLPTSLDLYKMANSATWKSARGTLPFNGKSNDDRGFVRALGTTSLGGGKTFKNVLQTHPEWKDAMQTRVAALANDNSLSGFGR